MSIEIASYFQSDVPSVEDADWLLDSIEEFVELLQRAVGRVETAKKYSLADFCPSEASADSFFCDSHCAAASNEHPALVIDAFGATRIVTEASVVVTYDNYVRLLAHEVLPSLGAYAFFGRMSLDQTSSATRVGFVNFFNPALRPAHFSSFLADQF